MHTELAGVPEALFGFLAVLARVAGAVAFVPLPGFRNAPEPVRAALALSLTIALAPLWPVMSGFEPSAGRFLALLASEAALGITAGLAVSFLIESLLVAAQVFGLQAGYSYASTVDPSTEADSNVLLVIAQLMAGLLFFSMGLDREVVRAFAHSLAAHPPGTYLVTPKAAATMIALGSNMLATGVRLALPVVVLLMLVDVALALLGRMHQQLQLLTLAFPAKMLATLAFLAAILILFLPAYRAAAGRTMTALTRLL
ncbi:MAG: flagellar biosynthetic protein FliR [Acidobacteriota bacterium]